MSSRREKPRTGREPLFEPAKAASTDCSRSVFSRFASIKRRWLPLNNDYWSR